MRSLVDSFAGPLAKTRFLSKFVNNFIVLYPRSFGCARLRRSNPAPSSRRVARAKSCAPPTRSKRKLWAWTSDGHVSTTNVGFSNRRENIGLSPPITGTRLFGVKTKLHFSCEVLSGITWFAACICGLRSVFTNFEFYYILVLYFRLLIGYRTVYSPVPPPFWLPGCKTVVGLVVCSYGRSPMEV